MTCVLIGCFGQPSEDNDMKDWRLSGRFYESAVKENYKEASLKLDSLDISTCFLNEKIVDKIIEVLVKTDQAEKVKTILDRLDKTWSYYHLLEADLEDHPSFKKICAEFKKNHSVSHKSLQRNLIKMLILDQQIRGADMDDLKKRYQITDKELLLPESNYSEEEYNKLELQKIIKELGFPSINMVGIDGMKAVFYIIQHANHDLTWQEAQLPFIERAVNDGNLTKADYAYLLDRTRILKGEYQVYGTQFIIKDISNIEIQLEQVEDPNNLDKRRKEANLLPIETYLEVVHWELSKM